MAKSKEEIQAEIQLAEAMTELAKGINKFTDPIYMQKLVSDAMRGMLSIPTVAMSVQQALPLGVTVDSITVKLSDEQRQEMAEQTYELLKPQIAEFNVFVKKSLTEMPAHRLKDLADKVKAGAKLHLRQRSGCIFIETDDGEGFYLGL